jgi:hypothetical protein
MKKGGFKSSWQLSRIITCRASLGATIPERIEGARIPFLLNKKGILAPSIPSGILASKLVRKHNIMAKLVNMYAIIW